MTLVTRVYFAVTMLFVRTGRKATAVVRWDGGNVDGTVMKSFSLIGHRICLVKMDGQ